jgi:hypothetical protein
MTMEPHRQNRVQRYACAHNPSSPSKQAAVWKARAEDIIRAKDLPDATSEEKTND